LFGHLLFKTKSQNLTEMIAKHYLIIAYYMQ